MTVSILFLLAILGALIYWFGNPKAAEIGKIIFFCAMLWITHELSGGRFRL